jgi:uncharacterized protein (DUF427 family)
VKARWGDITLAESDRSVEVRGYRYFPRDAVRMELLAPAVRTPHDLECPHGVQFFDVVDGDVRGERQAWSYEAPQPSMALVDHWIGFWRDVVVE